VWQWITTHWGWISGAGVVLLCSLLNLVTQHYGDARPRLKRALLFTVDLLSMVMSRGAVVPAFTAQGIRFKVPLVQTSSLTEAQLRARNAGVRVEP